MPRIQSLVGSFRRMANPTATGVSRMVQVTAPGRISSRRCWVCGFSALQRRAAITERHGNEAAREDLMAPRLTARRQNVASAPRRMLRGSEPLPPCIARRSRVPMPRRKTDAKAAPPPPADDDAVEADDEAEEEDVDIDVEALAVEEEDDDDEEEDVDLDEDDDDDDDEEDEVLVSVAVPPRPAVKPSPGRPPSAKEEPEPPFWIGERVRLVKNTRPRTGSPIGDHPVGAQGRVETVLSQTAIVRFDRAPDTKEVVAFECLESLDQVAMAARAERDAEKAAEAAAREKEAAKDGAAPKKK